MTRNSSPPSRNRVSSLRNVFFSAAATRSRQASPAMCPNRSLMSLKLSTSRKITAAPAARTRSISSRSRRRFASAVSGSRSTSWRRRSWDTSSSRLRCSRCCDDDSSMTTRIARAMSRSAPASRNEAYGMVWPSAARSHSAPSSFGTLWRKSRPSTSRAIPSQREREPRGRRSTHTAPEVRRVPATSDVPNRRDACVGASRPSARLQAATAATTHRARKGWAAPGRKWLRAPVTSSRTYEVLSATYAIAARRMAGADDSVVASNADATAPVSATHAAAQRRTSCRRIVRVRARKKAARSITVPSWTLSDQRASSSNSELTVSTPQRSGKRLRRCGHSSSFALVAGSGPPCARTARPAGATGRCRCGPRAGRES